MPYIIINGPNLNLLGVREPSIYGSEGFATYLTTLQDTFPDIVLNYYQSNSEGALVDKLHEVGFSYDGIVLNAGAYTHTSVALADAVAAINSQVVEVHISNIYAREAFRHHSYISAHAAGIIVGCGLAGYRLALEYLMRRQ
jgi:3-dehydroquinate dehydratase-2